MKIKRKHINEQRESLRLILIAGMILLRGLGWASAKIVLILAFQWITSPVSTHRISRVEVMSNPDYDQHCEVK